ncbi:MAG TPA: response regulator transcription factor [Roseomonas sp.]|jgi:DNA-binding response OmpR family regulator
MIRTLLIDDDAEFSDSVRGYLSAHGFEVRAVTGSAPAFASLAEFKPAIIIIDQHLAGESGTEVFRKLSAMTAAPCMFLSGGREEVDRVVALELGAYDYVAKLTPPREIVARIRSILRRATAPQTAPAVPAAAPPAGGFGWHLSIEKRELFRPDGQACTLTASEFEVLQVLVAARGKVLSRDEISERAFHRPFRPGDRAVDMAVMKIRRKIEINQHHPQAIKSVRPFGYVFTDFPVGVPAEDAADPA